MLYFLFLNSTITVELHTMAIELELETDIWIQQRAGDPSAGSIAADSGIPAIGWAGN